MQTEQMRCSIYVYVYILLLLSLLLLVYYYQYYYYHYYYQCYYTQTPRFAQAQNSANTREFCTTSNNGKDLMFNYVARVLTRTCCFYISYNQNMLCRFYISQLINTVIRVSYRVSRRYQNQYHHHRHPHHHHHHHHHRHPPHHHHRHLGLPRRSLRVRANLRVLPYMMMMIIIIL